MYKIQSFIKSNDNYRIAFGEAEQETLAWLHDNDNRIEVVSVSPSWLVVDNSPDGRFTYIITVAYKTA